MLVSLLTFAAGCSDSEPDVSTPALTPSSSAAEEVYQDVTDRGVAIDRKDFDLIAEAVCDRDMPDRQTESQAWNREADTIGELGGLKSFLDARVVVSEIDDNICT